MESGLVCCLIVSFLKVLTVESVPKQDIKMFLHFPTLSLLQIKLLFIHRFLPLLKVNWINVINTNQPKQEHTYVPRVHPVLLYQRICVIHQPSLVNGDTILWFLILVNESHWFEDLVEHDVIDLVVNWQVYLQSLKYPEVLPNESLCRVLLVCVIDSLLGLHLIRLLLSLNHVLALFLPPQRVPVQQLINRCLPCHLFALLRYARVKRILQIELIDILGNVLLVFQSVKSLMHRCHVLTTVTRVWIYFWAESLVLFLAFNRHLEVTFLGLNLLDVLILIF